MKENVAKIMMERETRVARIMSRLAIRITKEKQTRMKRIARRRMERAKMTMIQKQG